MYNVKLKIDDQYVSARVHTSDYAKMHESWLPNTERLETFGSPLFNRAKGF